ERAGGRTRLTLRCDRDKHLKTKCYRVEELPQQDDDSCGNGAGGAGGCGGFPGSVGEAAQQTQPFVPNPSPPGDPGNYPQPPAPPASTSDGEYGDSSPPLGVRDE